MFPTECNSLSHSSSSYSLRVSAIFDHIGYPSPQLDQWQQYDLGATQDLLHRMWNRLAKGLPAVASPPRTGPHDSPLLPTSLATRPIHGSKLVKAPRGGAHPRMPPPPSPPLLRQWHLLKWRQKGGRIRGERPPNAL